MGNDQDTTTTEVEGLNPAGGSHVLKAGIHVQYVFYMRHFNAPFNDIMYDSCRLRLVESVAMVTLE